MINKYEERLGTERMLPLIFKMALPAVAAQFVNLLYSIVDRVYIGHIPGIGTDALAGVGVTTSLIILISSFSAIVGGGGAPLAAIALGQGDRLRAGKILGNGFVLLQGGRIMAITGIDNSSYTSYYASGYKNTVKKAACDIQKTKENSLVGKTEESQEDYVKKLQEKNPQIDIVAGSSDKNVKTANRTGKTDVRIAPEILNRMMSNPEVATKYENMLSKIPALDRWADSMIKSMTGSEVKYRQIWIDKDGNMGSMVITGPSEEQKRAYEDRKIEKKKENEQKLVERRAERKEQMKKIQEDRRTIFAIGTDMKSITENVVAQAVGTAPSIGGSCDVKA